jgi:hypothetical protein
LRQVEVLAFDYPGRDKLMKADLRIRSGGSTGKALKIWIIAEDRLGISSAITIDLGCSWMIWV